MATPAATGAVTDATSVTTGDIIVVNTTANPTAQKYDWHIVTTGAAVNHANLRLDGASVAPTYVTGSRFSTITPAATAVDNGATGDIVFAQTTANAANNNAYNFHIVSNGATGANSTSLRFDNVQGNLTVQNAN